jgi:hypothetical protein
LITEPQGNCRIRKEIGLGRPRDHPVTASHGVISLSLLQPPCLLCQFVHTLYIIQSDTTMGLVKRFLRLSTVGGAASVGAFFWATRNDTFVPLPPSDHLFHSSIFHSLNPSRNPTTHDLCIRKVPLSDINPTLLEKKGKLVEAFCAGVWGGWGMLHVSMFMPL